MRPWLIIFVCFFAAPVNSAQTTDSSFITSALENLNRLNAELGDTEDERAIKPILEQKNLKLDELIRITHAFLRVVPA